MKKIAEFEDYYITIFGDVYSIYSHRFLKPIKDHHGYLNMYLCKNGKRKRFRIHRLVALVFIPNPCNKPCVNHIDGCKTNNFKNNLEWCTHSENEIHAFKIGIKNSKSIQGEKHYRSKLTEIEILVIHGLYLSGMKQKTISNLYSISHQHVSRIINGITWEHII